MALDSQIRVRTPFAPGSICRRRSARRRVAHYTIEAAYVGAAMTADAVLRVQPQNLDLPLREPATIP